MSDLERAEAETTKKNGAESGAEGNESAAESGVRAKRRVAGEVQGVGFRAATREAALRAGVRGWAKNESDGSVTVLMLGDDAGIGAMDEFLRQGPPTARVAGVAKLMLEEEEEKFNPRDFEIV